MNRDNKTLMDQILKLIVFNKNMIKSGLNITNDLLAACLFKYATIFSCSWDQLKSYYIKLNWYN